MPTEPTPTTASQPEVEANAVTRGLLDRIAEEGRVGQTPDERREGKRWLENLIQEVMTNQMTVSNDTELMLNERIKEIDELISRQLNEVMHSEEANRNI